MLERKGIGKKVEFLTLVVIIFIIALNVFSQDLIINNLGYFEKPGLNILVFSNRYTGYFFDEKTAGIEIIHHGVRVAQGGGVRLQPTPEQWDLIPKVEKRIVNCDENSIEVVLCYEQFDFHPRIVVKSEGESVKIMVYLDEPLPERLVGNAGLNLEFLPYAYFEKTFLMDNEPGIFPLYPTGPTVVKPIREKIRQFAGHSTFDDRGRGEFIEPLPIAVGNELVIAPEDPYRHIRIKSEKGKLMLYDGRNLAQNGWFVVRTVLPAEKTGEVVKWTLWANTVKKWKREPNITFSQVGYHPLQEKIAVIEHDKDDKVLKSAVLYKINPDGTHKKVFKKDVKEWGLFLRYRYGIFDFSEVQDTGLFIIRYGKYTTNPFPISRDVYKKIWEPTLGIFFPVQMDHMFVNEAYRVWHGLPYMDDALQAPINHVHFDGYFMRDTTDTKYKPFERIPGLNVGGWFDAGDFDIQTGHHCTAILNFVDTWEIFKVDYDQTYIDQKNRYVDIHRPDGKPDILQQIEHGTLQLVAQMKNIGHAVRGIVVGNLHQYTHLGDAHSITDGLMYDSTLAPGEVKCNRSGNMDDRWVFTNKDPALNYHTIAALAAAYRALKDFNDELAAQCISIAKSAWISQHEETGWDVISESPHPWYRRYRIYMINNELRAAFELYKTTEDKQYLDRFEKLVWVALDSALNSNIGIAVRAIPFFSGEYKEKLISYIEKFSRYCEDFKEENPFGVLIGFRPWAGNHELMEWGTTCYHVYKAFPDLLSPNYTIRSLNYVLGMHPYSNLSFVSAVGVKSKKVAYGGNRADFSFIAGGVVPGVLMLKPDFPENKEDWPFLWGENEYVISTCSVYIFIANAVNDLLVH